MLWLWHREEKQQKYDQKEITRQDISLMLRSHLILICYLSWKIQTQRNYTVSNKCLKIAALPARDTHGTHMHTNQLSTRGIVKSTGSEISYHQLASGDRRDQALTLFLAHSAACLMNSIDTDGVTGLASSLHTFKIPANLHKLFPWCHPALHQQRIAVKQDPPWVGRSALL